jgi:putative PIN family toxin of toxin-antitoxin system
VRIFLDTNVLASSIATRGLCSEVLESVLHDRELLIGDPVLTELERVMLSKFRLPKTIAAEFVALLRQEGQLVQAETPPSVRIKDPDDIPVVACAIAGGADLFVTGDRTLLDLQEIDGIPVVSPRQLWVRLAGI